MSISSIGGLSFWQQDQNYWTQQQANAESTQAESTLVSTISSAFTSEESGLSSIANQEALTRVNNQIAADQKALSGSSGSATPSASSSSSGPGPATATGTVPLTSSTPLSTLGIPPNGTITVTAGTNTTTYSSTGTDTVADLIGAINANMPGNAYVSASLNAKGNLVITGKNDTESVKVSGTFAPDVGFGVKNQTFNPTAGSTASSTSTPASTTASSSTSSSPANTTTTKAPTIVSQTQLGTISAASVLSQSGVAGSLIDMLA